MSLTPDVYYPPGTFAAPSSTNAQRTTWMNGSNADTLITDGTDPTLHMFITTVEANAGGGITDFKWIADLNPPFAVSQLHVYRRTIATDDHVYFGPSEFNIRTFNSSSAIHTWTCDVHVTSTNIRELRLFLSMINQEVGVYDYVIWFSNDISNFVPPVAVEDNIFTQRDELIDIDAVRDHLAGTKRPAQQISQANAITTLPNVVPAVVPKAPRIQGTKRTQPQQPAAKRQLTINQANRNFRGSAQHHLQIQFQEFMRQHQDREARRRPGLEGQGIHSMKKRNLQDFKKGPIKNI